MQNADVYECAIRQAWKLPKRYLSLTQRAVLQLLLIIIGVAFEAVRMGQGLQHPFILINTLGVKESEFFGTAEYFRQFIYYLCEHVKFIGVCVLWFYPQRPEDFKTDRFFLILALADLLDYILWGNNLWFYKVLIPHNGGFGLLAFMSMNLVAVVCFGLYANRQWKMNGRQ